LFDRAEGDATGTIVGFEVAGAEGVVGPDEAAGVTLGAGIGADVQATTRSATAVVVATRVSDGFIWVPLADVYQSDARRAPGCYAEILSVCRQADRRRPSVRGPP
jgi:hypothetical protein